jgi:hypothetical protein
VGVGGEWGGWAWWRPSRYSRTRRPCCGAALLIEPPSYTLKNSFSLACRRWEILLSQFCYRSGLSTRSSAVCSGFGEHGARSHMPSNMSQGTSRKIGATRTQRERPTELKYRARYWLQCHFAKEVHCSEVLCEFLTRFIQGAFRFLCIGRAAPSKVNSDKAGGWVFYSIQRREAVVYGLGWLIHGVYVTHSHEPRNKGTRARSQKAVN